MAKATQTEQAPASQEKKNVPSKHKYTKSEVWSVIIRIWRVLVASSIIYAAVVIVLGTEDWESRVMLIPGVLYAFYLLIKK